MFRLTLAIALALTACGGDDAPPSGDAGLDAATDAPAAVCSTAPDGTACGSGQICVGGTCVAGECGDGFVDTAAGEECDDSNDVAGDGCEPGGCTFSCADDADCDDLDPCNGEETCNPTLHRCQAGAPACDDAEPCTADSCDPTKGCINELIDVDGDMYAPGACTTGLMGGDCNDTSFSIYPGATELCDGLDNDCDTMIDDGTVDIDCYRDADGDTYGDDTDVVTACTCPTGYITRGGDCEDNLATVNPMHGTYESAYYCIGGAATCVVSRRSWDWDCSGYNEQRYISIYSMCAYGPPGCSLCVCQGGGWVTSVPACGTSASYRPCGAGLGCSAGTPYSLVQTCR